MSVDPPRFTNISSSGGHGLFRPCHSTIATITLKLATCVSVESVPVQCTETWGPSTIDTRYTRPVGDVQLTQIPPSYRYQFELRTRESQFDVDYFIFRI